MGASDCSGCAAAAAAFAVAVAATEVMAATRFGGGNCRLCGREYILGNVYANQAKALAEPTAATTAAAAPATATAAAAVATAAVAEAGTNELTNRTQHSTGCG